MKLGIFCSAFMVAGLAMSARAANLYDSIVADGALEVLEDIIDLADNNPNLSKDSSANCTNLIAYLSDTNNVTVFAPTDTAFGDCGITTGNVAGYDVDDLCALLLYHIHNEDKTLAELQARFFVTFVGMLNGKIAFFWQPGGTPQVNKGVLTSTDNVADAGRYHRIDKVLIRPNNWFNRSLPPYENCP